MSQAEIRDWRTAEGSQPEVRTPETVGIDSLTAIDPKKAEVVYKSILQGR